MRTCKIPHTDLVISRLAFGCGSLGHSGTPTEVPSFDAISASIDRWRMQPLAKEARDQAARMVHTAYDNGITLFDHADIYSFGKGEEAFGEVLKQSPGLRKSIVIQSKCGIRFAGDILDPRPDDPHRMDFSYEHLVASAESSLRRLATDYLDILLLHRPDALMEPEEVARAFDHLHSSGKVRYFGVSNHTPAQIELLKRYVRQRLVINQLHLGLSHSYLIADGLDANQDNTSRINTVYAGVGGTFDYCRLQDIQIQAWSPLKGSNVSPDLFGPSKNATPETRLAAATLEAIAAKYEVSPSAIALAWLLRHPAQIVPIVGTTSPQHLVENCEAHRVTLTREEWYTLFTLAARVSSIQLLGVVLPKKAV